MYLMWINPYCVQTAYLSLAKSGIFYVNSFD